MLLLFFIRLTWQSKQFILFITKQVINNIFVIEIFFIFVFLDFFQNIHSAFNEFLIWNSSVAFIKRSLILIKILNVIHKFFLVNFVCDESFFISKQICDLVKSRTFRWFLWPTLLNQLWIWLCYFWWNIRTMARSNLRLYLRKSQIFKRPFICNNWINNHAKSINITFFRAFLIII